MKKRLTDLLFRDIMKDKNIELKLGIIAILMLLAGIFATQCNGQQNITKRSVTLDSLISRQHDTIWITNGIGGKGWLRIADDTLFFSNIKANTLTFNEAFVDTSFFDEIIVRDTALIDFIIEHGGGALLVGNGLYIENDTIKLGGGTKIKDNTVIGVQHNSVDYYDNEYQKGIYIYVSKYPAGSAQSVSSLQVKADYNPTLSLYERLDSSTYIKFTGFHCPTGSAGLYAESRFNELGFSYKDTLAGRNKNNPRWIPDKAYVDGLCSSGGVLPGSLNEILLSDGAGGAATNNSIKWDAAEGGLFISDLNHDTVYLRPTGLFTHDGRQGIDFPIGYHPTTGYYYQSTLESNEDLAHLNRSRVRTYANSKHNYVYLEVERNPNYYTRAVLDSSGFYLADHFDTTLWGDAHLVTSRWVLDRLGGGSEYTAGNGIDITDSEISFSGTYITDGSILLYGSYNSDYSQLHISPGGNTTLSNTDDIKGNVSLQLNSDLQSIKMGLGSGPIFRANDYGFNYLQLSGSLTDGSPTAAEITAIVGVNASSVNTGAGHQITIKDSDGTGLLYKIESDGTDWYYQVLTKAL